MSESTKTSWRIAGEEVVSCNCSWGCPCQFNALPVWWPGAIHEGNGVWRTIVDEQATKEQREALVALASGQHGGTYWEVFAAVCPNRPEPLFAPITFNVDREKRHATVRVPDLIESDVEPIKSPHRVAEWLRI